jgi:CDP-diacylglycerol--glycerol-3-phosphate 3-phosphatidyltransferase
VSSLKDQEVDPELEKQHQSLGESWGEFVGRRAPNALTFLRFLLVPIFVILMEGETKHFWATFVFVLAAATDWLDGYLARLYQAESILGKVLDPLADKILVMAALILLSTFPESEGIPAWMVITLLSREMIINGLRSLAALNSTVVPASRLAKHKTAWTMTAIIILLMGQPVSFLNFHLLGMIALWIALTFSVVSAAQYAYALRRFYM